MKAKRYYFMIVSVALVLSALIISSVGGVVEAASRRDRFVQYWQMTQNQNRQNDNDNNDNDSRQTTTTTTPATPAPTTTTPAAPAAQAPASTPTPAQTTTATQTVAETPAEPTPVDTAPAAIATTTAQAADYTADPITYSSNQISEEFRNRLIMLGVVLSLTGILLYAVTFIKPAPRHPIGTPRRVSIPVRRVIPVTEIVSH